MKRQDGKIALSLELQVGNIFCVPGESYLGLTDASPTCRRSVLWCAAEGGAGSMGRSPTACCAGALAYALSRGPGHHPRHGGAAPPSTTPRRW